MTSLSAQERALAAVGRAAGSRAGRDEVAAEILASLDEVVDAAAIEISLADPFTGEHRVLANRGYDQRTLDFIDREYTVRDPGFREILAGRWPMRMQDTSFDYKAGYSFLEVWRPAGYEEGLTAALVTDDDRYVGMVNVSVEREDRVPDAMREFFGVLSPIMAGVFDPLADLLGWLQDDEVDRRLVVDASGRVLGCPDEGDPSPRVRRSTLAGIATRMLVADQPVRRGLVPGAEGRLVSVHLARARSARLSAEPFVLASLREIDVPFGLTVRETEVLRHVISGRSNREIAQALGIAPRTVATHVEHLLAKFGAETRTAVAGRALEHGLVRLDLELEDEAPVSS